MISSMLSRCFCLWTVSRPYVPERFWDGRTLSCFHHQAGQRAWIFRSLVVIGLASSAARSSWRHRAPSRETAAGQRAVPLGIGDGIALASAKMSRLSMWAQHIAWPGNSRAVRGR